MNWINIYTPEVRSPVFIGCDPVARATWFSVMIYCADQENGGRLKSSKNWKDRQWQQMCGVTLEEINNSAPLLVWDGDDLIVWNYPTHSEAKCKVNRTSGSIGGKVRSEAKLAACKANGFKPKSEAISQANSQALSQATHEAFNEASHEAIHEAKDKDKDKDKDKGKEKDIDPEFDLFWSNYPRKEGKADARKAFKKIADKQSVVNASAVYANAVKQWPTKDQQFIPHASTWLNSARYEDDPKVWNRGTATQDEFGSVRSTEW